MCIRDSPFSAPAFIFSLSTNMVSIKGFIVERLKFTVSIASNINSLDVYKRQLEICTSIHNYYIVILLIFQ